jgi:hypothetical protein
MAVKLTLEQIIRQDCIPLKDCMLTLIDSSGEAAFLYFKEEELVEANYATLWGRDALIEIVSWKVCSHTVAPLPLGIKRSLWDPLAYLLNPVAATSTSGRLPLPAALKVPKSTGSAILDRYKGIPNLLKMVQLDHTGETVLYEWTPDKLEAENTEWLPEFASRVRAVGETLGFGGCDKWAIETEKNQIVGFLFDDKVIALMRRKDAMQEDLEAAITAVTEAL